MKGFEPVGDSIHKLDLTSGIGFSMLSILKSETKFMLEGEISADSDLSRIQGLADAKIVLDLAKLKSINSIGLRHFLKVINSWENLESLVYQNVNSFFADQIDLIPTLLPKGGVVESLQLEFECETCGEETVITLDTARLVEFNESGAPIKHFCPVCNEDRSFTTDEDYEFNFLSSLD